MADYTYDRGAYAPAATGKASLANWAGAAVSLALVIGIGVWGYKLIARDVSGVPVVMAMEGPMRIAPEQPGGVLADHQGLAVNDVAGFGTAAGPADKLVLAPRPAGLAEEDVASGLIRPAPQMAAAAQMPVLSQDTAVSIPEDSPLAQNPDLASIVDELARGATPLSPLDAGTDAPVQTSVADLPEGTSLAASDTALPGGLARSLRPKLRPGGLRIASLDPTPVAAQPAAAQIATLDPARLPVGTRLVQIGAFDSAEDARRAWTRLDQRFGDYLEGKDPVIQQASSGGRAFFRLRAHGFADLSDARRFCAALVAGNVDCIPVVTR